MAKTRLASEWPPWLVIIWLRTPAGEWWSGERIAGPIESHEDDSGVFADLIPADYDYEGRAAACWPDPFPWDDMDAYDDGTLYFGPLSAVFDVVPG
jgi:hypothetical protein